MSYLELIQKSVKKTDEKIGSVPKRFYFVPPIIIAVAISIGLFYSNPYWYTWTIESTLTTIIIGTLAFWVFGVLLLLGSILIFLFFSILVQEQRREARENRRNEIMEIFYTTLSEKGKDLNNELLEDILQKLSSLLDSVPDEPNSYEPFNEGWKERIRQLENEGQNQQKINKDTTMKLKNLKDNDELQQRHITWQNQSIFRLKWKHKKSEIKNLTERSKTVNTDNDVEPVNKKSKFESQD